GGGESASRRKPYLAHRRGEELDRESLEPCAVGLFETHLDERKRLLHSPGLVGKKGRLVRVLVLDLHRQIHVLKHREFLETHVGPAAGDPPLERGALAGDEINVPNFVSDVSPRVLNQ